MGYPNAQNNGEGAIPVWIAGGGVPVPPGYVLVEYEQVTDLTGTTPLDPPEGATLAVVQVNAGAVRYRRDGTSPTGSVGMIMYATGPAQPFTPSDDLEFIQATGTTASLNIEWYGPAA